MNHQAEYLEEELRKARAEIEELRKRVCVPVEALEHEFPLLPDDGLDEVAHHCEWAIQQDRKRLHALIATHQQPAPTADPWKASDVEYDRAIHHNPDAKAWADLFVQTFPAQADQHELMLGWFANAMMAMHDHLAQKEKPAAQDVEALVEALKDAIFWMEQMQADINACDRYAGSLADQDLYRQHINEAEAALAAHQSGGAR